RTIRYLFTNQALTPSSASRARLHFLREKTEVRKCRADRRFGDAQPQLIRGNEIVGANQPAIPDAGGLDNLVPCPVPPRLHRNSLDALPQANALAQADYVEAHRPAELQRQVGCGDRIIRRPAGGSVSVEQVLRSVPAAPAADVRGREARAGGEIPGEGRAPQLAEFPQRGEVG